MPTAHAITFYTEIFNEGKKLLNRGETTLYFIEASGMKKVNMPVELEEKLKVYF
jgi:acyl-CoA thioesterase FadM